MNAPTKYSYDALDFDLCALDDVISSYDASTDPILQPLWAQIAADLWAEIGAYGQEINQYGETMQGHLERISADGRDFMVQLGFSQTASNNFYDAFKLSDIGKLHRDYDIGIWSLPHRPTDEERAEKRKHTLRGLDYLEDAYARYDVSDAFLNHPHIKIVIPALMLYHHERLDGQGYAKKSANDLGKTMRLACIVDAYDGDRIHRPHQPAKRTPIEAIERMMALGEDKKYAGAFDADLLSAFKTFKS